MLESRARGEDATSTSSMTAVGINDRRLCVDSSR
jgi:hypothetical protein